jgi:membrane fusion protein (multidrug efflux system)
VTLRLAELARAQDDYQRRKSLLASGAVSNEELRHAEMAVGVAQAAVNAAREQSSAGSALISGTNVQRHPNVVKASTQLREALLAQERMTVYAPVAGQVAKRSVQLGQRVAPGAPLMAVIPTTQLWVDANFKESQLRHVRIGQPVLLLTDLYGISVTYHGKVAGLAAGTGSAFALLPAQNATGNWIKVVQRVPVRVDLDAKELAEHPLRVGLSMSADIDTDDNAKGSPVVTPAVAAAGYAQSEAAADAAVAALLTTALGESDDVAPAHRRHKGSVR